MEGLELWLASWSYSVAANMPALQAFLVML